MDVWALKPKKTYANRAIWNIGHVVNHNKIHARQFNKINWEIVSTSHDICRTKGLRGHLKRQQIRRRLWKMAQRKYPYLRRYVIPREINGHSKAFIKISHRHSSPSWHPRKYQHKVIKDWEIVAYAIVGILILCAIGFFS